MAFHALILRLAIAALPLAAVFAAPNKPEEQARFLAPGPEKLLVARRCANCHPAGNFTKHRKSQQDWEEVMADMAMRGAEIPDDDYDPIVAYLAANYGPSSKLNVNRAPVEELSKLLVISRDQAKALVAHRDSNGPFRHFEDLLKVPGLPASALESRRALLVF